MPNTLGCVLLGPSHRVSGSVRPIASRTFAGKPLLEWVTRRASEAQQLDGVVVVLPESGVQSELADIVPPDINIFHSDEPDALQRVCDALDYYPSESVVLIRIESPLIDPCLIDRLVTAVENDESIDYATFRSSDGQPLIHSRLGLVAEWCRVSALRRANDTAREQTVRENFTAFICVHPESFKLRLIPLPTALDRYDLRLSLQQQEDWENTEDIVEALGDEGLEWQNIANLLECHPALRQRMADLNDADPRPATK